MRGVSASVVCVDPLRTARRRPALAGRSTARGVRAALHRDQPESSWLDGRGLRAGTESRRLRIPGRGVTILSRQIAKLANALRRFPDALVGSTTAASRPARRTCRTSAPARSPTSRRSRTCVSRSRRTLRLAEGPRGTGAPFVEHPRRSSAHRLLWGSDSRRRTTTPTRTWSRSRGASAGLGASGQARFLAARRSSCGPSCRALTFAARSREPRRAHLAATGRRRSWSARDERTTRLRPSPPRRVSRLAPRWSSCSARRRPCARETTCVPMPKPTSSPSLKTTAALLTNEGIAAVERWRLAGR